MIKFRAWKKTGSPEMFSDIAFIDFNKQVVGINYHNPSYRLDEEPLDNVIIMQSSGYKDKNGVEIFIDDLVADEYGRVYRVVFKGDCIRGDAVKSEHKNRWLSSFLEVIGNIYENPEMIK